MKNDKPIIILITTFVAMFFAIGITMYHRDQMYKSEIKNLRLLIAHNTASLGDLDVRESRNHYANETAEYNLNVMVQRLSERMGVAEASINPGDQRWAKIKKVRDAIKEVAVGKLRIEELTDIASAVVDYGSEFDVKISLILGTMRQESNFNRYAISSVGAQGLLQVMPGTAEDIKGWINVRYYNPWKPRDNVRFGTYYISRMLHEFEGNEDLAIRSYNAGPEFVHKVQGGEWDSYRQETIDYLVKVKQWKKEFENQGIVW